MQYSLSICCRLLFLLTLNLFIFSCKQKEQKLSPQEALEVARKIDSTILKKQPRYINELLDRELFTDRIAKSNNSKNKAAIISGIKSAWRQFELGDKIIQSLGETGHYQLVKHYEKEGKQHLIYRLYSAEGLNYHDIELTRYKNKPRIADIYIYLSGENFSHTIAELAKTFAGNIEDEKSEDVIDGVTRIREYMSKGEYDQAEKAYLGLPQHAKEQRSIRLIAIMLYKDLNEDKYLEHLESFKVAFPDQPNIDLLMIDAYIIKKDYAKAIQAIDKLDQFINKDTFLDYYRGLIYNMEGNTAKAATYFERLYKNHPEFGDGLAELIAALIEEKKNEEANKYIRLYKNNKTFDQEMLDNYLSMQLNFEYKTEQ